jgi:ankyrin repeat protein
VDINQRDLLLGWTALHFAAERGNEGMVRELITRNAFVNAKTKAGMTPLHLAMNRKHRAVQVLLEPYGGGL